MAPHPLVTRTTRARAFGTLLAPSTQLVLLFMLGYPIKAALISLDPANYKIFAAYANYGPRVIDFVLIAIAFVALLLGRHFGRLRALQTPQHAGFRSVRTRNAVRLAGVTGILLAGVATLALSRSAGLSPTELRPFRTATRAALLLQFEGRGFLALLITLLPLFVVMAKPAHSRWFIPSFIVPLLVALGVLSLMGSRLLLLGTLISVIVAIRLDRERPPRITRELGLLFLLGFGGAALGTLIMPGFSITSPVDLIHRLMGTFDMADTTMLATQHSHHFFGLTFLEDIFTTYIPRGLWSGKPQFYGGYRLQEVILPGIGASSSNSAFYPTGLVGEGFLNFGVLGAALVPGLAGYMTARLDRWALDDGVHRIVYCFLAGQILTLLRSPGQFLSFTVIVLVATRIVTFACAWAQHPVVAERPVHATVHTK